ncbi:AraC family transcriptional regulator ligand-binding domain-containing protein [Pseudomonas citronellolis]|uniref:AraC family transcriptional regulator ligand-binding domain-containing protein n=1 Tax=Pseudomonas citronellolis TaxID=53408 RepID=A0AAW6P737_9PSED|nr:AraC family transcriptional regulator ligand-binding domain-containing protein [Pseudomonas citronellolis]MDF3842874.1 AraC family transcriptional regulator ligand-binding domain-containing protein [Pseudomonas citronellolis]
MATPVQPRHRGAMGRVLARYLGEHSDAEEFDRAQLERLWQRAARIDPAIGLHLFSHFLPRERFVLVPLTLCCSDVGEALRHWQRFARLGSDLDRLRIVEAAGEVVLEVQIQASESLRRHYSEHALAMTMTQLREGCVEPVLPLRAEFAYSRPPYHAEYREWFGPNLQFGCERTRLVFDRSVLKVAMRGHHPVLVELIVSGLEQRLARLQQFSGAAARVAQHVRGELESGAAPSLESAAAALHMTPRTLRRRLLEQNLGYRQVLAAVRTELEQYLELQGLDRERIATRLGYADTAAYLRARKRWQEHDEAE